MTAVITECRQVYDTYLDVRNALQGRTEIERGALAEATVIKLKEYQAVVNEIKAKLKKV